MTASAEDPAWIGGQRHPVGEASASDPVDPAALSESIGTLCTAIEAPVDHPSLSGICPDRRQVLPMPSPTAPLAGDR